VCGCARGSTEKKLWGEGVKGEAQRLLIRCERRKVGGKVEVENGKRKSRKWGEKQKEQLRLWF
jgi:hypothetical protein